MKVFASALALVRGLFGFVGLDFSPFLGLGFMKRPLFLLLWLKGVSGFVGWSSVSFSVSLDNEMNINRFVGLLVDFQLANSWLHLIRK